MAEEVPGLAKVRSLTVRERRFLELYFEHQGNGTAAMLALAAERGQVMSSEVARTSAPRILRRIRKHPDFRDKLDAAGLDVLSLLRKALELLDCKKPVIDYKSGNVLAEYPDGLTQTKVLEMATGWHGLTPKNVLEISEALPAIIIETPEGDA